jgi:hypothetical protein
MHFSYGSERIDAVFDHLEAALRRMFRVAIRENDDSGAVGGVGTL